MFLFGEKIYHILITNNYNRRLSVEKVDENENLGPCTKLNQKCLVKSSGWPHQKWSIYFGMDYTYNVFSRYIVKLDVSVVCPS